jgi:hypothetical protein
VNSAVVIYFGKGRQQAGPHFETEVLRGTAERTGLTEHKRAGKRKRCTLRRGAENNQEKNNKKRRSKRHANSPEHSH